MGDLGVRERGGDRAGDRQSTRVPPA
jgi:hypothetical protein